MQDKSLISRRFSHSLNEYSRLALVQQRIAIKLAKRIAEQHLNPTNGLEIGCGTGFLSSELVKLFPKTNWNAIDLVENCKQYIPSNIQFTKGDGEYFDYENQYDIIASSSTIQWFDNLEEFIKRTHKALSNKGLIALSTFGPENFKEIAATTEQTLPYFTLEQIKNLCTKAGYNVVYSTEWKETLNFATPIDVLHHIRATGVNALPPTRWTKTRLQKFSEDYFAKFDSAILTFHPQIIICSK